MASKKKARPRGDGYSFQPLLGPTGTPSSVAMDIRLQRAMARKQSGIRRLASVSTNVDEIAVIAKVTDAAAWEAMSEVRRAVRIGKPDKDGTAIVTGRIPVTRITHVREQAFVVSLKAAQRIRPDLAAGVTETEAQLSNFVSIPTSGRGGKGTIVGVIDFGCDFVHKNFRNASGTTRIKKFWDQNADGGGSSPLGYGRVHTSTAINAALRTATPYTTLGHNPGRQSHGTHVMDIAAGNGRGSGAAGVAPNAGLIFVELAASDVAWEGPEAVDASFGDSVQLLEAIAWIFEEAGNAPCVVNMSLGTNGGPHDGSTLVEQGIDRLVRQKPNRAVVIAAGNAYADGIHAQGTVKKTTAYDLAWAIAPGDETENELELWYPGARRLRAEIISPSGQSLGTVEPGASGSITQGGRTVVFVANRLGDPNNGDNTIGVFIDPSMAPGTWKIRLKSLDNTEVPFHAWIERDDFGQSTFLAPARNDASTLGSLSCSQESIVVGSYDAHVAAKTISWFSGSGPTRDGRSKPEISAPGHDVIAAESRTTTGTTSMSGTSMAAPMVAGAVSVLLGAAKAKGRNLTVTQIRTAVLASARSGPPPAGSFDKRYGKGRMSVKKLLQAANLL